MQLSFTPSHCEFRQTVRSWLAEHVPDEALPSLDTAEVNTNNRMTGPANQLRIGVGAAIYSSISGRDSKSGTSTR